MFFTPTPSFSPSAAPHLPGTPYKLMMVPSLPMQSILDERWGNSECSSVRMGRATWYVLLVPDYFAPEQTSEYIET